MKEVPAASPNISGKESFQSRTDPAGKSGWPDRMRLEVVTDRNFVDPTEGTYPIWKDTPFCKNHVFKRHIFTMLPVNFIQGAPWEVNRLRLQGLFKFLTHTLALMVGPCADNSKGVVKMRLVKT